MKTLLNMKHRFTRSHRRNITQRVLQMTLFCLLCLLATTGHASVSITTNTLIDVGDTTYDGQDIVVNNCTLTVNGQHAFGSLQAVNNAVVTHTAATTSQT